MRVLQVHARYRLEGGEEVVVARERALLEAAGHEVALHERANASLAVRARGEQARLTVWNGAAAREVADAARRHRAEVVHVHNTFPALSPAVFAAARSTGAAVVATLHNHRVACVNALLLRDGTTCTKCVGRQVAWPGVRHACAEGDRARSLVVATMLATARARGVWTRHVDAVITPTRFGREVARLSGVPDRLVIVRPHGVPAAPDLAGAFDVEAARGGDDAFATDGSLSRERSGVVCIARLSREKGPDLLLDAWELLGADAPALTLIGEGPMHAELEARIAAAAGAGGLGRVRLVGAADDAFLARERAHARLSVSPSRAVESFGLTIAEAAAAGLPSVVSGHGALACLVDDGRTGWHVPPADARALADAVAAAHADPAEAARRGAAAHVRWAAEWAEPVALASLEGAYADAVRHRTRPPA